MSCIPKLTNAINYDCTTINRAKAGLESKAVIINKQALDLTTLTQSGATVTNMLLKSGTTAYEVSFVKQAADTSSKFVVNSNGYNTFEHSFNCQVYGQAAADAVTIKALSDGEFVIVVETKWKGTGNVDSYKVYGLDNSLFMSAGEASSIKDDGVFNFTLSSVKGYGEKYPFLTYLASTYAASALKFNANFA